MTESNSTYSLSDQIAETQAKIQLLEKEREVQSTSDQATMEKNNETICSLKEEIKNFSEDLADANKADEKIIEAAFFNRGPEKLVYRDKSIEEVLETLQEKKVAEVKQCDAQKHTNKSYQSRLEELEMEYERQKQLAERQAEKKADDDDKKCFLEIEVEHAMARVREAEKTTANFLKMKTNIQEAKLTLEGEIDRLTEEHRKQKMELWRFQQIEQKAIATREDSEAELQQLQERLHRKHRERDRTLERFRRDDQTACSSLKWDEESDESGAEEEEEKDFSIFRKVFRSLQEATGATNLQEVVDRFIFQKEKAEQLLNEKEKNEAELQKLKEEQTLQSQQINNIKHPGEVELCSDGQTQEELKQKLLAEQKKFNPAKDSWLIETMSAARAGVEHLGHKLQVSVGEDVDPDSEEFVVLLMDQVKRRIQDMLTELQTTDVAAVLKEAEKEQVLTRVKEALPSYNTQIKQSDDGRQESEDKEDDDEDDDSEDEDVFTLKAQQNSKKLKKGRF